MRPVITRPNSSQNRGFVSSADISVYTSSFVHPTASKPPPLSHRTFDRRLPPRSSLQPSGPPLSAPPIPVSIRSASCPVCRPLVCVFVSSFAEGALPFCFVFVYIGSRNTTPAQCSAYLIATAALKPPFLANRVTFFSASINSSSRPCVIALSSILDGPYICVVSPSYSRSFVSARLAQLASTEIGPALFPFSPQPLVKRGRIW